MQPVNNYKMNAQETYKNHRNEITKKVQELQELLGELDRKQAQEPRNWGFAGTAGHINKELDEILETLGASK